MSHFHLIVIIMLIPTGLSCSIDILYNMEKEQTKGIVLKHEIKKERVSTYPFFLVSTTYSHEPEYSFIVTIDYNYDTSVLSFYPFKADLSKLSPCTISLSEVLTRKSVTAIYVHKLKYRVHSNGLSITEAEFVLGHRSGQVALIHYKQKESKMIHRFNKSLKGEGFFSKTSSFFFGNEDSYAPFFKDMAKTFRNESNDDLKYSYQVGNQILFLDELVQARQAAFLHLYQQNNEQAYALTFDLYTVAAKGALSMFGTDQYFALKDKEHRIAMVKFNHQVSSYVLLPQHRKELAVALGSKDTILILQTQKFVLKSKIHTQMTIRKLNFFDHLDHCFLALMVYDNYVVLYDLNTQRYCKLTGHRSFIANVQYDSSQQMLVSAGMDHRISLSKLSAIEQKHWQQSEISNRVSTVMDSDIKGVRFQDIYSPGEYDNKRSNQHSYGFAQIMMMNDFYCVMTYDAKIMMYRYA